MKWNYYQGYAHGAGATHVKNDGYVMTSDTWVGGCHWDVIGLRILKRLMAHGVCDKREIIVNSLWKIHCAFQA